MAVEKCIAEAMKAIKKSEASAMKYLVNATRKPPIYVKSLIRRARDPKAFGRLIERERDIAIAVTWLVFLKKIRNDLQPTQR